MFHHKLADISRVSQNSTFLNLCSDAEGTVITGTGYAPVSVLAADWTVTGTDEDVSVVAENVVSLEFPVAGDDWQAATHLRLSSNANGTGAIWTIQLSEPYQAIESTMPTVLAGNLVLTVED